MFIYETPLESNWIALVEGKNQMKHSKRLSWFPVENLNCNKQNCLDAKQIVFIEA